MRKANPVFLYTLLAILVAGCQTLGLEKPKTFNERAEYVTSSVSAVVKAATTGVSAGTVSVADAESISKSGKEVYAALKLATDAYGVGDISTAEGRLRAAEALLRQLQARVKP